MLPFVSAMANASLPNGSFAEALKWPQQAHEIGEEVDVDPTSHEATTAPVDVLKHWTPLPISPVETRTCAPSAEVSKMPPVLTNDFEAAEENGEEDEGEAIWNGAETPANAEVALNSPYASNVAASPSHAMAKISFAAQKLCVYPSRLFLKVWHGQTRDLAAAAAFSRTRAARIDPQIEREETTGWRGSE